MNKSQLQLCWPNNEKKMERLSNQNNLIRRRWVESDVRHETLFSCWRCLFFFLKPLSVKKRFFSLSESVEIRDSGRQSGAPLETIRGSYSIGNCPSSCFGCCNRMNSFKWQNVNGWTFYLYRVIISVTDRTEVISFCNMSGLPPHNRYRSAHLSTINPDISN